jgi:hypothetical protein
MKNAKLVFCGVLLSAFALLAVACGAVKQGIQAGQDAMSLTLLGHTYQTYCTANKKGPANADDLLKSANAQNEKNAIQEVKDGKFTLIWNVNLDDPSGGNANKVLGYAAAPINGQRVVLFGSGKVEAIPEADFQAKPKAAPGTGAAPAEKAAPPKTKDKKGQ